MIWLLLVALINGNGVLQFNVSAYSDSAKCETALLTDTTKNVVRRYCEAVDVR